MSLFRRGPDTSMSLEAGTTAAKHHGGKRGKHRVWSDDCTYTWGTCAVRSKDSEEGPLPHLCGEGPKKHNTHVCVLCEQPRS